ncbi:TetR/AcrR family transcriptional regulator [soil metagenome]
MSVSTLKSPRKPRGSGHLRRSEILDAAQRIFFESGYQGATVRKIAQAVGVSSTAIYLHFPDKAAMLAEIAAEAIDGLLIEAKAVAAEQTCPLARARRILQAYVCFGLTNRSAYMVIFSDAQSELPRGADSARDRFQAYYLTFVGVITELHEKDQLRGRCPLVVAQTLWGGCHGLCTLQITHPTFEWAPIEDLSRTMIDSLLAGAVEG